MTETVSELDMTREQLARAEKALEAIRRDIFPINETRYRLMAEAYVGQIYTLRSQIDGYLGIEAGSAQQAELVISLEGKNVRLGETAVGVMTRTLDAFRRGLQSLVAYKSAISVKAAGRRPGWIEKLCDLPLIGVQPGSLQIILGEPENGDLFAEENRNLLRESLNLFFSGLRWAANDNSDCPSEFSSNPELWRLVLGMLRTLVPPRNGPIEMIGFRGMAFNDRQKLQLHASVRERITRAIAQPQETAEFKELKGTIREVDLDEKTFTLRERPDGLPDLGCEYDEASKASVIESLDEPVILTGVLRKSRKSLKETMEVETIELDLANESDIGDS
jgi:hypothetical protein